MPHVAGSHDPPRHGLPAGEPGQVGGRDLCGLTVHRYRVDERIGAGGMGEVYRAYDTLLRREVALKRVRPGIATDEENRRRILREARAACALSHPSIVAIHDVLDFQGETLIVQELVCGAPLTAQLGRPIPLAHFFCIAQECAGALATAAAKGIVHCDLKPDNIILTQDGHPRILDFGISHCRVIDSEGTTETSAGERIAGTPAYMAPEVIDGREPTPASDIFSLGVIFYELLAGAHPFRRPTVAGTLASVLHEEPLPPSVSNAALPGALDDLIARMLAKEPERRYASPEELFRDLSRIREGWQGAGGREAYPTDTAGGTTARETTTVFGEPRPGGTGLSESSQLPPVPCAPRTTHPARGTLSRFLAPFRRGRRRGAARRHLVVKHFESRIPDPTVTSFAAGLTEAVAARLAGLEGIHVVEAAAGVEGALTLEGSLQRASNRLRIPYRIVDWERGHTIGGDVVEGDVRDLFDLEDRVTEGVARALVQEYGLPPLAETPRRSTGDVTAYDLYLQARGYLGRFQDAGNIELAIQLFQKSLERDAGFALALAGLGEAYWRRYEATRDTSWVREAEKVSRAALAAGPGRAEPHVTLGTVYLGTGRTEAAGREFRRAIALDAKNDAAFRGLARAEEEQGKLADAEETYRRAIHARPDYWAGHNDLGKFYYRHGRHEDALAAFLSVVELTPDNALGYSNLGVTYQCLDRDAEAIAAYECSLRLKPNHRAYSNLATLLRAQGRYEEAAATYERALALDEADYRIWWSLAGTYKLIEGKGVEVARALGRAVAIMEAQISVNPRDALLAALLSQYHAELGRPEEARKLAGRALGLAPQDAELLFHLVHTYEGLGDREQALIMVRRALRAGYKVEAFRKEPELAGLVADPRFEQTVREVRP